VKERCDRCGFFNHSAKDCYTSQETIDRFKGSRGNNNQQQQRAPQEHQDRKRKRDSDGRSFSQYLTRIFRAKTLKDAAADYFVYADSAAERNVLTAPLIEHFVDNVNVEMSNSNASAKVQFGAGEPIRASGIANFGIMKDTLVLDDSRVHPSTNLLSLPQLDKEGYKMIISNGTIDYFKSDTEIRVYGKGSFMTSHLQDGLYSTSVEDILKAFPSSTSSSSTTPTGTETDGSRRSGCIPSETKIYSMLASNDVGCVDDVDDDDDTHLSLTSKVTAVNKVTQARGGTGHFAIVTQIDLLKLQNTGL
jgi:hypothetical protein